MEMPVSSRTGSSIQATPTRFQADEGSICNCTCRGNASSPNFTARHRGSSPLTTNAEIEHLLITVGGPDIDGIRYPGEEILGAFVAEGPSLTIEAEHLRSVTMHLWSAAQVIEVEVSRRSGAGTIPPV